MKKFIFLIVSLTLILCIFTACGDKKDDSSTTELTSERTTDVYNSIPETSVTENSTEPSTQSATAKKTEVSKTEKTSTQTSKKTEKTSSKTATAKTTTTTKKPSGNGLMKKEGIASGYIGHINIAFYPGEKIEKVTVYLLDGSKRSINSKTNPDNFKWSEDGLSVSVDISEFYPDESVDRFAYVDVRIEGYNLVINSDLKSVA